MYFNDLESTGGPYAVATLHRAENTDDREALNAILTFLNDRARDYPIVFPVHPRTRKQLGNGISILIG